MPKAKTIADKLLIKPGMTVAVVNAPKGLESVEGAALAKDVKSASAALLYAATAADVDAHLPKVMKALSGEARLWIAYPKAGKLGTDLNRDLLWKQVEPRGFESVRLVSLDDTWSAFAFRRG
jgi:hypothetical protein